MRGQLLQDIGLGGGRAVYITTESTGGLWGLVGLGTGTTYNGFSKDANEAIGNDWNDFIIVTSPVTLTPQI